MGVEQLGSWIVPEKNITKIKVLARPGVHRSRRRSLLREDGWFDQRRIGVTGTRAVHPR